MFWGKPKPVDTCLRCYPLSRRQGISRDCPGNDCQRETSIPKMERPMKKSKVPKIDSIEKLADFWDTHDLTDFEDELEEVTEPVFVRRTPIEITLEPREAKAVQQMAKAKGVSREELIRAWVLQQIARPGNGRRTAKPR